VRHLKIIGIGAGDPEHVTVQAIDALNRIDVFFVVDKGEEKVDLLHLRNEICTRYISHRDYRTVELQDPHRDVNGASYSAAVREWHLKRVVQWERALATELDDGQVGAFLAWGDPAVYDSTLRILDGVRSRGALQFELEVIPGLGAVQVLAARHQIPLTQIGQSVLITSGRQLLEEWHGGENDVVVMLDANCTFLQLDDDRTTIYWGAFLGTKDEILISGTIAQCGLEIKRAREEARRRKGWVFDTYLLRAEK
jgi:precorrin-6A synthase